MEWIDTYHSPLGQMLIAADEIGITGIWFEKQKYYANALSKTCEKAKTPAIQAAERWMTLYFEGKNPDFSVPLHLIGTAFQRQVWELLLAIPYGKTCTYGELAARIAKQTGRERMSAQAVGSAVGHNKVSILVPCHRVVGAGGNLTGYAGGLDKKIFLLKLENGYQPNFYLP